MSNQDTVEAGTAQTLKTGEAYVTALSGNANIDAIHGRTQCALNTRSGPGLHPDALVPVAKILAEAPGQASSWYEHGRAAMAAAYNSRARMVSAVEANTKASYRNDGSLINSLVAPEKVGPIRDALNAEFARSAQRIEAHSLQIQEGLKTLDRKIESTFTPKSNDARSAALAVELRGYVSRLSDDKRMTFLQAAIQDGDLETVQSILAAPCYASGLNKGQIAILKHFAIEKLCPLEHQQKDALLRVLSAVDKAGAALMADYAKLLPPLRNDPGSEALRAMSAGR